MDKKLPLSTPSRYGSKRKQSYGLSRSKRISEPFVSPVLKRQDTQENKICKKIKFDNQQVAKETSNHCDELDISDSSPLSATPTTCSLSPTTLTPSTPTFSPPLNTSTQSTPILSPPLSTTTPSMPASTSKQIRDLNLLLAEKQETLRKLNMNNLDELQHLINKWRQASQNAAERLLDSINTNITMTQLLDQMQINHELVRYSEEDETFLPS